MEMKNSKTAGKMLVAVLLSLLTAILLSAVVSIFISNGTIGLGILPWVCILINGISSFIGTSTVMGSDGTKPLIKCAITVGGYLLVLLLLNWSFWNGLSENWFYTVLACVAGGLLPCILGSKKKRPMKRYK